MGFTHFDAAGNAVMVDVSDKPVTSRTAVAKGSIRVSKEIVDAVTKGGIQKGDVLGLARVAGIMATKRTSELIPLTHPLPLTKCSVDFAIDEAAGLITAFCTAKTDGKTGVEMEALTGVTIALLTIYDMCKAIDKHMCIGDVHLVEKHGGKSGDFKYKNEPALLAVSGIKNSGKTTLIERLIPLLSQRGIKVAVIKHDGHSYTPDTEGTDSYRFFQAGACASVIFDSEKFTLTQRSAVTETMFTEMFPEADIILLEGFKSSSYPKIEIVRKGISDRPVCDEETCAAYVSDTDYPFSKPVFHPDAAEAIAESIMAYVKGTRDA